MGSEEIKGNTISMRPGLTMESQFMIDQIRHLQARVPFEIFSIELANGRVLQVYDRHSVATTEGVIGVLHQSGAFEVINADQVVGVSVGRHPTVEQELAERREWVEKMFGGEEKAST
jgi:hypothetical protein